MSDNGNGNGSVPSNGSSGAPAKRGRPTTFTEDLGREICIRLAGGESLRHICRDDHMPIHTTVLGWAFNDNLGFYDHYAQARQMQAEYWADEIVDISDDGSNDWYEKERKDGTVIKLPDQEYINRSKLRVDTRKWLMSKLYPKRWGDKIDIDAKVMVVDLVLEFDDDG